MKPRVVTKMEKTIVNVINGEEIIIRKQLVTDDVLRYVINLGKYLKRKYPDYEAVHVGKTHSVNGDIQLLKQSDTGALLVKTIELKFVKKTKKGTLANLGQDFLYRNNVFDLSWKEHSKDFNLQEKIIDIMKKYGYANKSISTQKAFTEEGRRIREDAKKGDMYAMICKDEIIKLANSEKMKFLEKVDYVSKEDLKLFYINMIFGNHRINSYDKDISKHIETNNVDGQIEIYYLNLNDGSVATEDSELEGLISEHFDMEHTIENACVTITYKREPIMRISLNYKNVFQGIKNPAINVFI